MIDYDEILRLTEQYGGKWGINHTLRLLKLVDCIGEGMEYNREAVWIAAHLHDWGAYPIFLQKNGDHAQRSREVAEQFLIERDCPPDLITLVLEIIEFHHLPHPDRSIEVILLADADALDFLGIVGILRDFSRNNKDLRKAFEISMKRRNELPGKLILDVSRQLAIQRLNFMDEIFSRMEEESFGYF
jgi:uncharacterized protein